MREGIRFRATPAVHTAHVCCCHCGCLNLPIYNNHRTISAAPTTVKATAADTARTSASETAANNVSQVARGFRSIVAVIIVVLLLLLKPHRLRQMSPRYPFACLLSCLPTCLLFFSAFETSFLGCRIPVPATHSLMHYRNTGPSDEGRRFSAVSLLTAADYG